MKMALIAVGSICQSFWHIKEIPENTNLHLGL